MSEAQIEELMIITRNTNISLMIITICLMIIAAVAILSLVTSWLRY